MAVKLDIPRNGTLPHYEAEVPYSVARAVRLLAAGRPVDGLEGETSRELEHRRGIPARGVLVPLDAPMRTPRGPQRRALDTGTAAGTVPLPVLFPVIDFLRARSLVLRFGGRDLEIQFGSGTPAIPRRSAVATMGWILPEGGSPAAESNQTLDQVKFAPHTLTGYTELTRFGRDLIPNAAEVIWEDLLAGIAVEFDRVALNGSGGAGQPLGIFQNPAITASRTIAIGTNGGAITWGFLCQMERLVSQGNADANLDTLGWLAAPLVRSACRQTARVTSGQVCWDDDEMMGHVAEATNQIPANFTKGTGTGLGGIVFGDWSQVVLGHYGAVDMLVDPYRQSTTGVIRYRAYLDCDVQVRHAEAFSVCVDITTSGA